MSYSQILLARLSLSFLWIWSGMSSIFFAPATGLEVLTGAGLGNSTAEALLWLGGLLDIAIGIWLLTTCFTALCCLAQLMTIIIYSALLTLIDASYWIHPFGPLSKNIPTMALIYLVYRSQKPLTSNTDSNV